MPEEDGDDTGIRISAAARAATSRFRRNRSTLSRYAWAISLGIHGIVLVGAFCALKYYFRPLPAPKPQAEITDPNAIGPVITSTDATDLVHAGFGIALIPDEPSLDGRLDSRDLPSFVRGEPKTVATLSHLSAISGIDGLSLGADSVVHGPAALPRRTAAATQPGGNATK
jgi:hypothetical protein